MQRWPIRRRLLQPGPPRYDVGVEFEDVDASAREFLERFVESRA